MDRLKDSQWDTKELYYSSARPGVGHPYENELGMRYPVNGSVVLKPVFDPDYDPAEKKSRKDMEEKRLRRVALLRQYKQKERGVSKKRLKESLAVIIAVAVVTGMFSVVLFRQAQIASLNFQNNATQRRIDTIRQETAQIREGLILGTDLEMIRREAMERLGMQKPGSNQIISSAKVSGDKLITGDSDSSIDVSPEALAKAKEDLAKYFSND